MSATVLAVDLGGTHYRAGAASSDNPASVRPIGAWPTPSTRDEFLAMLESQFAELGATASASGFRDWPTGQPAAGSRTFPISTASTSPPLSRRRRCARQRRPSRSARRSLGGAAAELSDAILLAIGTGIGSAVLADGHIIGGRRGGACSFGWAAADLVDPEEDRHRVARTALFRSSA